MFARGQMQLTVYWCAIWRVFLVRKPYLLVFSLQHKYHMYVQYVWMDACYSRWYEHVGMLPQLLVYASSAVCPLLVLVGLHAALRLPVVSARV